MTTPLMEQLAAALRYWLPKAQPFEQQWRDPICASVRAEWQKANELLRTYRQQAAEPAESFTADEVHAYCARARKETRAAVLKEVVEMLVEEHELSRGRHNYAAYYSHKVRNMKGFMIEE